MNETSAKHLSGNLAVTLATKVDQPILANLLELYVHHFSEFLQIKIGFDGRFGYEQLPLYWMEPTRHPFLIRIDDSLAGLALIKQGSEVSNDPNVWDMAEFFILRAYRRHGIGTAAAHALWKIFPGQWEVRVMQRNDSAKHFWAHAIEAFTGNYGTSLCREEWQALGIVLIFVSTRNLANKYGLRLTGTPRRM